MTFNKQEIWGCNVCIYSNYLVFSVPVTVALVLCVSLGTYRPGSGKCNRKERLRGFTCKIDAVNV